MATTLLTPVGRIVWGNPAKPRIKKDDKTKHPILRDGKQVEQWAFGVAFEKSVFNTQIWPAMMAEAQTVYPQGFPPAFSWKFKDGDTVDRAGKPYSAREGYAGCFVLGISTEAFAPPIYRYENNAYRQINPDEIKCGDYVALNLNIKANKPVDVSHTPGLYINPNGIELVGFGTEIVSAGADANEMFGAAGQRQAHALPPGASAAPVSSAPANVGMPVQAANGMPAGMPTAAPVVHAAPPVVPPAPVAPVAPPAPVAFPPAGWTAHPSAPGFYYQGQTVLSEADLRAQSAPAAPVAPPLPPAAHDFVQAAQGMPAQPANGLPAGMPGMPAPR
jgi:hypothetical protein